MNASDRTEKQLDVFIEPAPQAGPLKLRPFSAGTLTLCRKLGLTMILGSAEDKAALTDEEKQRQITAFLFIQCAPIETVKKAAKLAREDMAAFEDQYLLDFELNLPVGAMAQAVEHLAAGIEQVGAAQFETATREDGTGGPAETPPPNS
jgi:hypothetical protein